tara:strand:+ start:16 stop:378 length:363 start_codon:yes stop_codon:yes gene_type:complete
MTSEVQFYKNLLQHEMEESKKIYHEYNEMKEKKEKLQDEINDLRESEALELGEWAYIQLRKENRKLKDEIQDYEDGKIQDEDELTASHARIDELEEENKILKEVIFKTFGSGTIVMKTKK